MVRHSVIPVERIASRIFLVRGEKVMLDSDLAALYGVETGALVRAVKRNQNRFPKDFSFQLSDLEFVNLRCQTNWHLKSMGRPPLSPVCFHRAGSCHAFQCAPQRPGR
jgi:hypothetical protein